MEQITSFLNKQSDTAPYIKKHKHMIFNEITTTPTKIKVT